MKKEELIKEAVYQTLREASGFSIQFYDEECREELDINQRKYIGDTFAELIKILNEHYLVNSYKKHEEKRLRLLFEIYLYCIEKGIEVTYNLRKGLNEPINFNGANIGIGIVGLDLADEVLPQLEEPIQRVEILMEEVYDTLQYKKLITSRTRPYVYEAMLWGAVYVGVEWCLRMDLE